MKWRNKKTGQVYVKIGYARNANNNATIPELMVIYRHIDDEGANSMYVRNLEKFNSKFDPIPE